LLVVVARSGPDGLFPSEDVFERQLSSEKATGLDRSSGPVSTIDPADDEAGAALDLVSVRELAWAFKRCASRLAEMAAPDWPQKLTEVSASA
jgi:predicted ATPase